MSQSAACRSSQQPSRADPGSSLFRRQVVGNALVAVDAGVTARQRLVHDLRGDRNLRRVTRRGHRRNRMAASAFGRIVRPQRAPNPLRHFEAARLVLGGRADGGPKVFPAVSHSGCHVIERAGEEVGGNVTVRAAGANSERVRRVRPMREFRGGLGHLVARGAKCLGGRILQRCVAAAADGDSGDHRQQTPRRDAKQIPALRPPPQPFAESTARRFIQWLAAERWHWAQATNASLPLWHAKHFPSPLWSAIEIKPCFWVSNSCAPVARHRVWQSTHMKPRAAWVP